MATYTRREVVTRRVEFTVPAPAPAPYSYGAAYVEVIKAINAAQEELRVAQREVADDTITIAPGDDCVIVSYEAEDRQA